MFAGQTLHVKLMLAVQAVQSWCGAFASSFWNMLSFVPVGF